MIKKTKNTVYIFLSIIISIMFSQSSLLAEQKTTITTTLINDSLWNIKLGTQAVNIANIIKFHGVIYPVGEDWKKPSQQSYTGNNETFAPSGTAYIYYDPNLPPLTMDLNNKNDSKSFPEAGVRIDIEAKPVTIIYETYPKTFTKDFFEYTIKVIGAKIGN